MLPGSIKSTLGLHLLLLTELVFRIGEKGRYIICIMGDITVFNNLYNCVRKAKILIRNYALITLFYYFFVFIK